MATQIPVPDDMLVPGDLVDFTYQVRPGASATMVDLALDSVKKTLATDPRFDYQGSRWEERTDLETGTAYQYIIITVSVRSDPKQPITVVWDNQGHRWIVDDPAASKAEQKAGVGMVAIGVLTGLVFAGIVAYASALIYRDYVIRKLATDPSLSESTKEAAIDALGKSGEVFGGLSTTVAAAGGSLFAVAIVIAVLWGLSLLGRGSGGRGTHV